MCLFYIVSFFGNKCVTGLGYAIFIKMHVNVLSGSYRIT